MRRIISKIPLWGFLLYGCFAFSQKVKSDDWTTKETMYYKNLKELAEYVNQEDKVSKDTLFKKYIYFDNILKDSIEERKNKRLAVFDTIFSFVPKTIKSNGIENLEAKPLRFYKNHKIYEPFKAALKEVSCDVMVYYNKEKPEEPLGTLLFEPESHKLVAWILLKQGDGGWFFLTFNLL
ncbi:MAG: hypothetical protein R2819_05975 [Allomuricauda sp.]